MKTSTTLLRGGAVAALLLAATAAVAGHAPQAEGDADAASGTRGSNPASLTPFKGKLYFSANDGVHGAELWATDGTAAGTVMVADISRGSRGSNPRNFAVLEGKLFFSADDGVHGAELWFTDGTTTAMLKDINPKAPAPDEVAPAPY